MISFFRNNIEKLIALLIVIFCIAFFLLQNNKTEGSVLADVNVTGTIYSCIHNFTVVPEKRIPSTGNFSNQVNFEIYDSSNNLAGSFDASTDAIANGTINICDEGVYLLPDDYDIYIKGRSHLRKYFGTFTNSFYYVETTEDYSNAGTDLLLAGETSNVYNNYINTLDISTQITNMETASVINDLNADGEVNTLDISNTVFNFYLEGDCSPQEAANNICDI